MSRYETFDIKEMKFDLENNQIFLMGQTIDGKQREFGFQIVRNLATNQLFFQPYRHFIDPDSKPAFTGSEPWTRDERRGDTQ